MKLQKLKLNEVSRAELNEREMCRILGGGTSGCCQCGCEYAGTGGSSTSSNSSANNAQGYTSDPNAQPCCSTTPTYPPLPPYKEIPNPQSSLCPGSQSYSCR